MLYSMEGTIIQLMQYCIRHFNLLAWLAELHTSYVGLHDLSENSVESYPTRFRGGDVWRVTCDAWYVAVLFSQVMYECG